MYQRHNVLLICNLAAFACLAIGCTQRNDGNQCYSLEGCLPASDVPGAAGHYNTCCLTISDCTDDGGAEIIGARCK